MEMAMSFALLHQPTSLLSCSSSCSPRFPVSSRPQNQLLRFRYERSKWCGGNQLCTWSESTKQNFKLVRRLKVAEDDNKSNDILPSVERAPTTASVGRKAQVKDAKEKVQSTAVITGVIAVLLGLGYLVLVQILDTRGIILVPPPPEAFEP